MLEKLTGPLPTGLRIATRNLFSEFNTFLAHRQGLAQARKYRGSSDLKLHLGCGKNYKEGWVNVDLHRTADVRLDLREPLPFEDASCSMIYSEHFLEHIDYPEPITSLLGECCRVLKPGGVFSVVVPDIELVLRSYVEGGTEEYYAAQRKWHPEWYKTQMEHINYNFRQNNEHRFCYDFETLNYLLEKCGFVEVRCRSFEVSLDRKDREVGSLYAEALKPAG